MITFLFWNIRKQPILDRVARIAGRHGVDLLILAECEADPLAVLAVLNNSGGSMWEYPTCTPTKLQVFSRLPSGSVVDLFSTVNERLTIREVRPSGREPILMTAVHLVAKSGGWTDHSQASVARPIAESVERIEQLHGNPRTVLIGDLNMTPFAPGMIDGFVFHAFMTRNLAAGRSGRVVQGERCRRAFFNPMWPFLADRDDKPPGTYYWDEAVPDNHYWYTLDQVLVRPELSDKVVSVDIIDTDGIRSLTTAGGRPDADSASDHLPIVVTLHV